VTRTLVADGAEIATEPAATTGAWGKAVWAIAGSPEAKNATLARKRDAIDMR
jgi:hypothetical protein